jgi:pilus assembly protein CpaE
LQAQSTLVDLVGNVDDLDTELFDNIVTTHGSGLKVLLGPARPEFADEVRQHQNAVARIIEKIAGNYDFVVVDTSTSMDEMLLGLLDIATKIMLVSTTSLPSVKNTRFVLDLFDQLGYPPEKSMLVLNKVWEESQRKNATLAPERIEAYLKRPIEMRLPFVDERTILTAIVKGTPVIASDRDTNKPMIKELLQLADKVSAMLMPQEEEEQQPAKAPAKNSGFQFPIGKKK